MRIEYWGNRDSCTNGKRIAYITYKKEEEENVERFVEKIVKPFFTDEFAFEEECLTIYVSDRGEYDRMKEMWVRFKKGEI